MLYVLPESKAMLTKFTPNQFLKTRISTSDTGHAVAALFSSQVVSHKI